jgi:hypothetical protein
VHNTRLSVRLPDGEPDIAAVRFDAEISPTVPAVAKLTDGKLVFWPGRRYSRRACRAFTHFAPLAIYSDTVADSESPALESEHEQPYR